MYYVKKVNFSDVQCIAPLIPIKPQYFIMINEAAQTSSTFGQTLPFAVDWHLVFIPIRKMESVMLYRSGQLCKRSPPPPPMGKKKVISL